MKQFGQVMVDVSLLTLAFGAAYLLRYDFDVPFQIWKKIAFQLPYVVPVEYGVLALFGANRIVWRFISLSDLRTFVRPLLLTAGMLAIVRTASPSLPFAHKTYLAVPHGVILINLLLAMSMILGVRMLRRLFAERSDRSRIRAPAHVRRLLLAGAGESGVHVAKEIDRRPDLGLKLVGFADDDPMKRATRVCGYPVLGRLPQLEELIEQNAVDEVVIAITDASADTMRSIVAMCERQAVAVRVVPGLYEIIGGQVSVSRLREVRIDDLLGRDTVQLDTQRLGDFIRHKVVAVTGAGGSIGSELCQQIAEFGPRRLLLIERSEHALFEVHRTLKNNFPHLVVEPCLADVTVPVRLREVLVRFGCDAIIHAAAHKHVPMMECNPSEAIRNNVLGTQCVADMAAELGVGHFVLISTDKAINPTSVMGASKRVAELYVQAMGRAHSATTFVSVRFGNVLGSAGSVVPIFKQQIAAGGPVMVTHPEMVRYFMTIPEAAQLVLQAATYGNGGEVFVLDMGQPVKIVDLARDLIRLSGLVPDQDVQIQFSGTRPGEKLFEELGTDSERATKTAHSKIFVGHVKESSLASLAVSLTALKASMEAPDPLAIYTALRDLIPEFSGTHGNEPADSKPQVRPLRVAR